MAGKERHHHTPAQLDGRVHLGAGDDGGGQTAPSMMQFAMKPVLPVALQNTIATLLIIFSLTLIYCYCF